MVDEDAGQLVADRLVDQHRRDRGIDAARQAADHPALADLVADLGDLGRAELGHRPVAGEAADVADEIGDQLAAVGGVDHLGMELDAVEAALLVGGRREGRAVGRRRRRGSPAGMRLDLVAMAHPHLVALARRPQAVEQRGNRPVISMKARPNSLWSPAATRPPSCSAISLLAVADAEHRHARLEQMLPAARGLSSKVTEAGPPDRMMPSRLHPLKRLERRG